NRTQPKLSAHAADHAYVEWHSEPAVKPASALAVERSSRTGNRCGIVWQHSSATISAATGTLWHRTVRGRGARIDDESATHGPAYRGKLEAEGKRMAFLTHRRCVEPLGGQPAKWTSGAAESG